MINGWTNFVHRNGKTLQIELTGDPASTRTRDLLLRRTFLRGFSTFTFFSVFQLLQIKTKT